MFCQHRRYLPGDLFQFGSSVGRRQVEKHGADIAKQPAAFFKRFHCIGKGRRRLLAGNSLNIFALFFHAFLKGREVMLVRNAAKRRNVKGCIICLK